MILVEVNSNSGAFCFKWFETKEQAQHFCKELSKKCNTLKAFIKN